MNGNRRVGGAIGTGSAICFAIGFALGSLLEDATVGAWVAHTFGAALTVVAVAGWAAFMVTSARVGPPTRYGGWVALVAALTMSVFFGISSSPGLQMIDSDGWTWAIPYLGAPVLLGAFFGALGGGMQPNRH